MRFKVGQNNITHADRIRATSSDEEMAAELMPLLGETSKDYILFWLQQPAEETL